MGVVAVAMLLVPVSASAAPEDMDPTFSGDGLALPLGTEGAGTDVAIDSEGRIVASFSRSGSTADGGVVRLLPDGSLDPSFSGDGIFRYGGFTATTRVAVDPLDRILVAGWEVPGGQTIVSNVVRITEGGALDSSFDGNGSRGLGRMIVSALQVRPDSRVVLAITPPNTVIGGLAASIPEESNRGSVLQLTVSGAPDPSFGSSGSAPVDFGFTNPTKTGLRDLVLDDLGRAVGLVLANFGVSPNDLSWNAVRLDANGDPDPTFNGGDPSRIGYIPLDRGWTSVDTDSSEQIVLAGGGFSQAARESFTTVRRFTANGSLDAGQFGVAGTSVVDLGPGWDSPGQIVSGPDGNIWIAGGSSDPGDYPDTPPSPYSVLLGRLTETGAIDATFSGDGNASAEIGIGQRMALDSLGRVVVVGLGDGSPTRDPQGLLVARYLQDGGVPGTLPTPPPGGGGSGGAGGVAGTVATSARNVQIHKLVIPRSMRKLARRGVKVLASCDEDCRIVLEVEVSGQTADDMGLTGTLLARGSAPASAGQLRWVRARFNADVRRALRRYAGSGRLRVNVTGVAP